MSGKLKLSKMKMNPSNPRVIKDDRFRKLVKSLREFPEMMEKRPMVCVTDSDGKIYPLGGNMRLKALRELGMKEVPEEWVMMADEWSEEKRREFVLKDNISFGEWDWDMIANEWDAEQVEEWGLDIPEWDNEEEGADEIDVKDLFDIDIPFYTPSEDKPDVKDLADINTTKNLISDINKLSVDDDLKEILRIRAGFFTDFNFDKIADFYCKESEDVKEVFKKLGMVVLAPKEAMKNGFVELKENISDV